MIRVTYYPDVLDIEVEGHSGSAERGEDLICAAASMLAATLEQVFIVQDSMEGHIARSEKGARFHAWVNKGSDLAGQAFVVMETIATGYLALAEKYPEFVSFEIREGER